MKRAPLPLLLTALAALAVGGCKSDPPTTALVSSSSGNASSVLGTEPIKAVPDKDRYKVTADETGLFRYSPLQASGSDLQLKKNARLTMIQRGRGFSQVKTEDNQTGYVGTEDIAQLPPNEIAQEDAATLQAAQAAAGAQLSPVATTLPAATGNTPVTKVGGKKASAATVEIPSDAGRSERLPEADATPKPKATPR